MNLKLYTIIIFLHNNSKDMVFCLYNLFFTISLTLKFTFLILSHNTNTVSIQANKILVEKIIIKGMVE